MCEDIYQTKLCGDLWKKCKPLKAAQKIRRVYVKQKVGSYKNLEGVRSYYCPGWTGLQAEEWTETATAEADRVRKEQRDKLEAMKLERKARLYQGESDYQSDQGFVSKLNFY